MRKLSFTCKIGAVGCQNSVPPVNRPIRNFGPSFGSPHATSAVISRNVKRIVRCSALSRTGFFGTAPRGQSVMIGGGCWKRWLLPSVSRSDRRTR